MRILIATSVYPPDIGGSAQYARNLYETWKKEGHDVVVAAYTWEWAMPPGLRHLLYFIKVLRKGWNADLVLLLDTWTAAVPTAVACFFLNKRYLLRSSSDFLWERYVDRTGDAVLFRDFYGTRLGRLSDREKVIFVAAQKVMRKAAAVIFSTEWQREIFESAYGLEPSKNTVVQNFCAQKSDPTAPEGRVFIGGTRFVKTKNQDILRQAFEDAQHELANLKKTASRPTLDVLADIRLDTSKATYDMFIGRMQRAWAVVLVSLGEMSPNIIFDAISAGIPFILTRENGIDNALADAGILVDPLNQKEITDKIVWLSDPVNRAIQAEKVRRLSCEHPWKEIADEIVAVWKQTPKD